MGTRFDILKGSIDLLEGTLETSGGTVPLTATEVALLGALHDASPEARSPAILLTEALGYAPAAKSRTVTVTIQRLRKKLEVDPAEPKTLVTVRGEGYALRYAEPRRVVPVSTAAPPGRDADLAAVDAAFGRGARPVVLVGPGGMGKTTLARAWAQREGAAWVELFDVRDAGELRRRLITVLDLGKEEDADTVLAARFARGTPLVLDNAEDLEPDACAALAHWFGARGTDPPAVLITSQTPLGLAEEQCVVLGGLSREAAREVLLAVRQRSGLDALDDDTLEMLLTRFGGVPLALVIAAPVADLLPDADDALELPGEGTADHHRTVTEGVGRSFSRLDSLSMGVAVALAVFPGSVDVRPLAEVAGVPLPSVLRALVSLRGCGLVRRDERRVDLIPLARTMLRRDAESAEARDACAQRLVAWLNSLGGAHAALKPHRQTLEHALGLSRGEQRLSLLFQHIELLYSFGPVADIVPQAQRWTADFDATMTWDAEALVSWAHLVAGHRSTGRERLQIAVEKPLHPIVFARCAAVLAMTHAWHQEPDGVALAERALASLGPDTPDHLRVEVGTHAGYALASLGVDRGLDELESVIRLAERALPARALTAALSKARLVPASIAELSRCRALLDRVGDTLGAVQRAVDTADLAVILLDAHHVEEAWALLQEPRRVMQTAHPPMLRTIFRSAASRLVDHPERALALVDEVGDGMGPQQAAFLRAVAAGDRAAIEGMDDELRTLGEAFLDGRELPECESMYLLRAGLKTVQSRGL